MGGRQCEKTPKHESHYANTCPGSARSSAHSGPFLRDTVLRGNWQKPAARAAEGRGQMKNPSGAVAAEKNTKPKHYTALPYITTKAQRRNTRPHPSVIPIHPIPNPNSEPPLPKSQDTKTQIPVTSCRKPNPKTVNPKTQRPKTSILHP